MNSTQPQVGLVQQAKYLLVRLGSGNILTRLALRAAARKSGIRLEFSPNKISLIRGGDVLVLRARDVSLVPEMVRLHSHYFSTLEAELEVGRRTLDFSSPSTHRYLRTGIAIRFPHVAEDDSMHSYTSRFVPQEGMTVFDVGAHAGLTTIELSRLVGAQGRVFAFEPDNLTRGFLVDNLKSEGVSNVTVLDVALGEVSGAKQFSMDGTQAAGLVETLVYRSSDSLREVEVVTLSDVCGQLRAVPHFIKSDIEGGELGMIRGSAGFLTQNPIHMAFETHRLPDGSNTADLLSPILSNAGYAVETLVEEDGQQNFMFATPARA